MSEEEKNREKREKQLDFAIVIIIYKYSAVITADSVSTKQKGKKFIILSILLLLLFNTAALWLHIYESSDHMAANRLNVILIIVL